MGRVVTVDARCRYEFAKLRLRQFRGAEQARLRRLENATTDEARAELEGVVPFFFYGRDLVRLVPSVAVHGVPKRFVWPVPVPDRGNNFLLAVPATPLQLEQGCLCPSSRCTLASARCNPSNTRRFASLPEPGDGGRIVLYTADGRPSTQLGPLITQSAQSGQRRRIAMFEYRDV
jgi:hypothetical protein